MTLKDMDYILELAQTQNFNRAAENLYSAQPTLSYHIKSVEELFYTPVACDTLSDEPLQVTQEFGMPRMASKFGLVFSLIGSIRVGFIQQEITGTNAVKP